MQICEWCNNFIDPDVEEEREDEFCSDICEARDMANIDGVDIVE